MEKMESSRASQPQVVLAPQTKNIVAKTFDMIKDNPRRVVAAAVIGAASVLSACGNSNTNSTKNHEVTAAQAKANCETFTNTNAAADSSRYDTSAFLPKGTIDSHASVGSYVKSLFSSTGPLAGKGDIGSLAAITAAITVPSEKGTTKANTYSYQGTFASSVAAFSSISGGKQAQQNACNSSFKVMNEDGDWNSNWAGPGQVVTQLIPTRNTSNNHIKTENGSDLKLEQVHLTGALKGAEFRSRKADKPGYNSVLITEQGDIFIQGIVSLEGNSNQQNGNGARITFEPNGTKVIVTKGPNGETITTTVSAGGTTTTKTTSGNGGGSGSGSGGSGSGAGNGGGSGSGSGGNGGGTTTTTTPPTTTTTVPSTTTTTVPPTTTTTLPKGPNPGCTPNPPYVICK
jgi:hypothetical protein